MNDLWLTHVIYMPFWRSFFFFSGYNPRLGGTGGFSPSEEYVGEAFRTRGEASCFCKDGSGVKTHHGPSRISWSFEVSCHLNLVA